MFSFSNCGTYVAKYLQNLQSDFFLLFRTRMLHTFHITKNSIFQVAIGEILSIIYKAIFSSDIIHFAHQHLNSRYLYLKQNEI